VLGGFADWDLPPDIFCRQAARRAADYGIKLPGFGCGNKCDL